MEFELHKWFQNREKPASQKFGDPVIIRAGQEIHVRDWIDEAREDTEIYKTLEKYGCIDRMIVNKEQVYGDLTQVMGLRDALEQIKEANKLWESLPLDFRREFMNDKAEFMRTGLDVLKKKIEAEKKKQEPAQTTTTEPAQPAQTEGAQ